MDILLALIIKMLPMYAIMAAGFCVGRKWPETVAPVSTVQIFLISPIVLATSIAGLKFQSAYLLLPFTFFIVCCAIALLTYRLARTPDGSGNLLAFACGSANNGYFGVPVALILFPPDIIGLFMLTGLGFIFFENTLGYYLIARGRFNARESFKRLLRLPPLHGALTGIVLSALHFAMPQPLEAITRDFRGAYVVFGALIIGLGLSRVKTLMPDLRFVGWTVVMKFAIWPLAVMGIIALDTHIFHLYDSATHAMIMLLGLLPIPANAVAYALQLDVQPEKAASAVFINTVIALFYIPIMAIVLGIV